MTAAQALDQLMKARLTKSKPELPIVIALTRSVKTENFIVPLKGSDDPAQLDWRALHGLEVHVYHPNTRFKILRRITDFILDATKPHSVWWIDLKTGWEELCWHTGDRLGACKISIERLGDA